MAIERFELIFRKSVPDEAAFDAALEQFSDQYGGKSDFMRECLLRGFKYMQRQVESARSSTNPVEAIDAMPLLLVNGSSFASMFLDTYQRSLEQREPPRSAQQASAAEAEVMDPVTSESGDLAAESDSVQTNNPPVDEKNIDVPPVAPEPPKQKGSWSHLRNIAGTPGSIKRD